MTGKRGWYECGSETDRCLYPRRHGTHPDPGTQLPGDPGAEGKNSFRKEGIIVPPDSVLALRGEGSLHINNNRNDSAGISARDNDPYGTIVLDLRGGPGRGRKPECLCARGSLFP